MIYITYKNSDFNNNQIVNNVWLVKFDNVEEKYIEFMHEKAKEINIVINPNWLNIMNFQDHNNHLSVVEYDNKKKQWFKIKRQWNIDKFIADVLKGYKECYKNVVRF